VPLHLTGSKTFNEHLRKRPQDEHHQAADGGLHGEQQHCLASQPPGGQRERHPQHQQDQERRVAGDFVAVVYGFHVAGHFRAVDDHFNPHQAGADISQDQQLDQQQGDKPETPALPRCQSTRQRQNAFSHG